MDRKEYVASELEQLQQVLELAEVAEEIYNQFPEDDEAIQNFHKARATRMIYIHRAFVNILGVYDEYTDYLLVDLMERKFESNESEEIDREVEKYFGELERKRSKKVIYKRLDNDDTTA